MLWSVRDRLEESASISVLDGDRILYIARAPAARLMVINLDVGSRLPANCTSNGRVLLSQLDAKAVDAYLGSTRLVQYTPKTIMSVDALRSELERVREQGYYQRRACSFLANGGRTIASVNISQGNARTAGRFRRETRLFYNAYETGHSFIGTLDPTIVASPGGFPLVEGDKLIGAIGCSGGTGDQDAAVCKVGAQLVE